ncbi:hypothetical protein CPB85DRAFT_1337159 [Mucidula mucida]|nr:hypothetical protein CPB85DRAFT_1337159 [Mucidula mucida]
MPKPKGKPAAKQPNAPPIYAPKDLVLGKVRGYPSWPGWIVDPVDAPPRVKAERPGKGGAKTSNLFSLVQFFPTGDFAWLAPKDISKLKSHEIDAYINEPTKKNGDLLAAYRVALKPEEWEAGRATMAVAEDEDAEADADADIDELASEPTDGKRKRKAPVKKTGKKAKKEAHDAESEDEGEPPAKKSKKSGKKDKEDDKKDEDAEGDADGEVTKDKKALEVRDWRHKLQKTFLSTKGVAVKDSDMPAMDTLFKTVENYEAITIDQLTFSKIGKVMRHINALGDDRLPPGCEAQFRFRERAKTLVDRWHQVLNGGKEDATKNGHVGKEVKEESKVDLKPAAVEQNGDTKMDSMFPPPPNMKQEVPIALPAPEPATNGTDKMDEDKKPEDLIPPPDEKAASALVEDAFMGDLTMDMSMES